MFIPMTTEFIDGRETRFDIFSRLLKDRIIMLCSPINADVASAVIAQLLFLSGTDPEAEIKLYIQSPGGVITAGMAIVDAMRAIPNKVTTICIGQSSSMGAIILSAGDRRKILPNARVLIHQPLAGFEGQCSDIQISAKNVQRWKDILNQFLADRTGQPLERIEKDTDRDTIFTAEEAVAYGLVDEIVELADKKC